MDDDSLQSQITRTFVEGIAPGTLDEGQDAAKLNEARQLCRDGNPFPLIAIQWPDLLIDDDAEAKFFQGQIGDELNPCLRLDWWQRMIALAFFDDSIREIYIKGCTGAGKGGIVSLCCCLLYDTSEILRLSFTGPKFEHTFKGIFGETYEWFGRMQYPRERSDASTTIASSSRHYIDIQNPQRGKTGEDFSGQHSRDPRGRIVVFDEATSSEDTWIENAEKNAFKIICLANPRTVMGAFRNAFKLLGDGKENKNGICMGKLGRRLCVTIGGSDCANVKYGRLKTPVAPRSGIEIDGHQYGPGERITPEHFELVKPLIPGQMDLSQFQAACSASETWKVRCFAHGMFPDEDPESQVILSSWLPRHVAHWDALEKGFSVPVNAFGLDVARSLAGDSSCLAAGSGVGVAGIYKEKFASYPEIAEWVMQTAIDKHGINLLDGNIPVCIDYGGGYGSGVGDWLAKAGVYIIQSMPGGRAQVMPQVYCNLRTEMYALFGIRLSPEHQWADDPFALPDDKELLEDLIHAVRDWTPDHSRFRLKSKDEIKASLGRSPDKGDAVALLFMAVREVEQMNEYMAAAAGELLTYPFKEAVAGSTLPPSPKTTANQIESIVEWMRSR